MGKLYLFLSVIYILSSIAVLNFKGYLSVRAYNVDKRPDVQRYLNNKYLDESFILINNQTLSSNINNSFNDLDSINLKRNFDFSVTVSTKTKEAFGKVDDNIYLDSSGKIFYSDLSLPSSLPQIYLKEYRKDYSYLDSNQMEFIKKINGYPNLSVYIISSSSIQIVADTYKLEVPNNFNSLSNMAVFVNAELKKDDSFKNLVVLKDKIVLKK